MIELWRAQPFPSDADCGYIELHTVTEKEMRQIKKGKPIRGEYRVRNVDNTKDTGGYFTEYDDAVAILKMVVEGRVARAESQARFAICSLVDEKDFRYRTMDAYA